MERNNRFRILLLAAAVGLGLCAAAAAQERPEYYERETNQHLGTHGDSYFYIHRLVKNGEDHHDNTNLFTYRDSTYLVERSLNGKTLRNRTLLRAEQRLLYYDEGGEPKFDSDVLFVIDKTSEELLPDGFTYADPDNPVWPCSFDYRVEGIYLIYEDLEHFLLPVTDFEHLFPEYGWFCQNSVPFETVEGYSGNADWYYVSIQPECMLDPVGICRQIVVPIPTKILTTIRAELLTGVDHKE